MSPSVVPEEVTQPQTIKEKVLSVLPNHTNGTDEHNKEANCTKETNGTRAAVPTNGHASQHSQHRPPLKPSGALDKFKHFDVTPVIGREYVDVDLKEWLRAENSDELIRDLAITSM